MLEDLRKKQKLVIWVIVVVFVVGMALMGVTSIFQDKKPLVGKINGEKITYEMFQQELQQNIQNYRQQNPDADITPDVMSNMVDQTWQRIQQKIILNAQIKKMRIKINDDDVIKEMENNPPQELMQNPQLQTNGRFDRKKYLTALKQDTQFFSIMDNYVRESLPYNRLMEKIKAKGNITLDSLKAEYVKQNDEMAGKAIWFNPAKVDKPVVTDAEIKTYYDKNKETDKEINKGKSFAMKFITFEQKPSEKDFALVKKDIDDIYISITKGEDFGLLAKDLSDDPGSAAQNGSLGAFGRGQMVPEFEKVAFGMQPGQFSKPFQTSFGWHIVRVDSLMTSPDGQPQVKASHILKKVNTSQDTKDALKDQAENSRKLIKKLGIDKASKQLKLNATDTDAIYEDGEYIPGIGKNDLLLAFMKKSKVGAVSTVVKDQKGNFIVGQMTMKAKDPYVPFEKAKIRIKFDLEKQKKVATLETIAKNFVAQTKPADYFTAAAADSMIKVVELKNFKTDTYVSEAGKVPEANVAALKLTDGQTSALVSTKEGPMIIYCEKRTKPDINAFLKDKALQDTLRKKMEEQSWNRWYDATMKSAKIVDNRAEFNFF